MDKIFLQLLNMSLTGGMAILFILLVRLLLKRAPKVFSYALWSVVLFRLLCPFSFESVVSLLPVKSQAVPMDIALSPAPRIDSGFAPLDAAVNSFLPAPTPGGSANPMQILLFLGEILWLAGAAALLLGSVISYIRLRLRLKGAVLAEKGVYEVPGLETPFLLGVFRPKIYLPAGLSGEERQYVLCHERTHLKRLDHLVKPLGYFALCLHWFNPLVWAAFFLMETDMELSCDESVLKQMGNGAKKGYSSSLLSMSAKGRVFGGSPLAFGEIRIKSRVKNVLRYKKPAFWALLTAVVVVAGTLLGLAGSPREKPKMDPDKLAAEFASLWKEKLWPEELSKSPGARPNGMGFLEDLNNDDIPELFFLYDLGETAQGLVYRLDDGSFTQLARFASTGFQDPERPIDLVFDLYHGEGVTVFRSSQTLYASSGSPQMQSIVEQFLIWKNGVLTSKTMERMESADGSQDTYFNPNPSDGRLEIPFEEFLAYRQSLLAGTSDTVEQLTVPGSYLVRDFLEGDALENHLRAILTQWKGQGHGNTRTAPPEDSGEGEPSQNTSSSSTASLVPQSLTFPDDPGFTLELSAPSTWEFREEEDGIRVYRYGLPIGQVSWSRFDIYLGVPEERFADMVYSTIHLGSIVYWEDYAEVAKTSHSASATATQYSAQILENQSAAAARRAERPGIMAYEVDVASFVTLCFEEGSVDPDELAAIAASVSLKPEGESPEAMLNRWLASVQLTEKGLSFQVPADCPDPENFKIQIRGRGEMDGMVLSFHDLEEKKWDAGESYQTNIEGTFLELLLSATYGEGTREVDLMPLLEQLSYQNNAAS